MVDRGCGGWFLEVLLNEHPDGRWVYRRRTAVRLPIDRLGAQRDEVPFLRPAVVLLYKSRHPTAKDEADFRVAEPRLSRDQRSWRRHALGTCTPQPPWLALLL